MESNQLYVFSSVTETYDNGSLNYRHLWARASTDGGGLSWGGDFDLSSELIHIFLMNVTLPVQLIRMIILFTLFIKRITNPDVPSGELLMHRSITKLFI
ncbi:MAG: hypothetical protein R2764_16165 [Bacteroidales bacterium]